MKFFFFGGGWWCFHFFVSFLSEFFPFSVKINAAFPLVFFISFFPSFY